MTPTSPGRGSTRDSARSGCPIARALEVLGDRWSLLVLRDLLFLGKRQYGELLASPEKISSNILAERLRRLEAWGLVERTPYQSNPVRYEYRPTAKAEALQPVLSALAEWGQTHLPEQR